MSTRVDLRHLRALRRVKRRGVKRRLAAIKETAGLESHGGPEAVA